MCIEFLRHCLVSDIRVLEPSLDFGSKFGIDVDIHRSTGPTDWLKGRHVRNSNDLQSTNHPCYNVPPLVRNEN